MTIVTSSTIADIRTVGVAPVLASATDLAAWSSLDLPASIGTYQTTNIFTGLFGYDLTAFFAYCVTASTNCDSTVYNSTYFDGWSLGGYLALSTYGNAAQNALVLMACLENEMSCFGLLTSATGTVDEAYTWNFGPSYTLSASVPTIAQSNNYAISAYDTGYGFIPHWWAAPTLYTSTVTSYIQFNNFQRVNDYYKVEVGETDVAWVISSVAADVGASESTAVTFASSAALEITAAIVLAALTTL